MRLTKSTSGMTSLKIVYNIYSSNVLVIQFCRIAPSVGIFPIQQILFARDLDLPQMEIAHKIEPHQSMLTYDAM